jgi:hypothetical protein
MKKYTPLEDALQKTANLLHQNSKDSKEAKVNQGLKNTSLKNEEILFNLNSIKNRTQKILKFYSEKNPHPQTQTQKIGCY